MQKRQSTAARMVEAPGHREERKGKVGMRWRHSRTTKALKHHRALLNYFQTFALDFLPMDSQSVSPLEIHVSSSTPLWLMELLTPDRRLKGILKGGVIAA